MPHFVPHVVHIKRVANGSGEPRYTAGFEGRAYRGEVSDAAAARGEHVPDVIPVETNDVVDGVLVLRQHGSSVGVGVRVRRTVQKDQFVVVGDEGQSDGHFGLHNAVDAVDGRVHGGQHAGDRASMKLTVLSRACQGQRIIAPGWTVRRANALGNLAVVKPSGATRHRCLFLPPFGAHHSRLSAFR